MPRREAAAHSVRVKRVYEPASRSDGARILVDRLWPRGVKKQDLAFDEWAKDVAPTPALRTWYGHRPERFEEFRRRYREELDSGDAHEAFDELRELAGSGTVTLLTATRDVERSGAAVLEEALLTPKGRSRRGRGRER
ncbi:MAG TPA: DUF488 family protein [Actinomycetota bacterium]|jgi:uncharacterized protein YeaO (DUF488 family)